jgi:hypothetical protein
MEYSKWSKVNKVKQIRYRGFLPNVSLRGARRRGPIPNTTTNPVWQPITSISRAFKDPTICQILRANMLLDGGLRTAQLLPRPEICDLLDMLAMIAMFASFFHFPQARGLDGSSFENSMSCFQGQIPL